VVLRHGDGHALVRQGHQYDDGRQPNAAEWSVDLVRPDGVMVSIFEYNAPRPKGAAISRSAPPFTPEDLMTWAGNDAWQTTISRARDIATSKLFQPTDPKVTLGGLAQSKAANARESEAATQAKGAKLARQRAQCAAAKAAHLTPPKFCATIK
jgi:hypothetical protein